MITFAPIRGETLVLLSLVVSLSGVVIWVRTLTVKSTYQYVQQEKELVKIQQELQMARVRWLKSLNSTRLKGLADQFELQAPTIEQRLKTSLNN